MTKCILETSQQKQSLALSFENVTFSYGKEPLLENLSCGFQKGKLTCVVGPNGCGKSTMLHIAEGILNQSEGAVYLAGKDASRLSQKERAKQLAFLPQIVKTPSMTVYDLVSYGRYPCLGFQGSLSQKDIQIIESSLRIADAYRFREAEVKTLSGGERQRAYLAMTIAQNTDTLVLDEPTTYLDVAACHGLMKLLRRLVDKEGKTVIAVIHDLDLALRYADELLVMSPWEKNGATVLIGGTVDEVLKTRAIQHAFEIEIVEHVTEKGRTYSFFPVN